MKEKVKIIPLGGVREDGENLYAVDINDGIYVLDCGLKYPENEMLGIDFVIPDMTYLRENRDRIVGVFLTHGHADAIGALPYFLADFDVPVFGSELTIALAKLLVKDNKGSSKFNNFNVINEDSEIIFDDATVTFFKTTHSIPESMGIVLDTKFGKIVYTGDFKFDQTASEDYQTDYATLGDIGRSGVLALLSDSSNAENPNQSTNERKIANYIDSTFAYNDSRIIVACAAYNILRIQQVFNAAAKSDRKVFLTNQNLEKIVNTAMKLKKLHLPKKDLLISKVSELDKLDPSETVILQTGKMGEPIKALQRMTSKQSNNNPISIKKGDLVLIATTPAPAMETNVARTRDMIYKADAEVKMISDDIKSSGDASQEDLQFMLNVLKPKYLIPVQGEYRMLEAHAGVAEEVGFPEKNIFIPAKGDVLEYDGNKMIRANGVDAGDVMIDGIGVGDIGNIVLRDRKVLSEDGIFVVVVTINRKKKTVIAQPKITSRGFIYVKANKSLMNEASKIVYDAVQYNLDNKEFDWGHLKQDVRDKLSSFLFDKTKRRPVILPVIMEVHQHHKGHKGSKRGTSPKGNN
ncbi:ribonuclease J [Nicoliella spurrieriana]|uniref:Ribonuclease J n=1 Tax=Nicoliella spurrieriana TaxID=2925830 RepID=A0A976X4Z1_9LACO|nr:ribonuclease J [Nicoliella spurrieriana]UQS86473.1 ribonuclease J [Nicoliella spurrieriana]